MTPAERFALAVLLDVARIALTTIAGAPLFVSAETKTKARQQLARIDAAIDGLRKERAA